MRKLFILFAVFLIFFSAAAPCFATNEGLYGHHVSAGQYEFDSVLSFDMLGSNVEYSANVSFTSNGTSYDVLRVAVNSVGELVYYQVGSNTASASNVYISNDQGTIWADQRYRYITVTEDFVITDSALFYFWRQNVRRVDVGSEEDSFEGILTVFSSVGVWLGSAFSTLQTIFWDSSAGLTIIGTLSVVALAFAVIFLIFAMLRSFLKFR